MLPPPTDNLVQMPRRKKYCVCKKCKQLFQPYKRDNMIFMNYCKPCMEFIEKGVDRGWNE